MELREIALLVGGFSLGMGVGLGIFGMYLLRKSRNVRYLRKASKRYDQLIGKINEDQARMQKTVDGFADIQKEFGNVA